MRESDTGCRSQCLRRSSLSFGGTPRRHAAHAVDDFSGVGENTQLGRRRRAFARSPGSHCKSRCNSRCCLRGGRSHTLNKTTSQNQLQVTVIRVCLSVLSLRRQRSLRPSLPAMILSRRSCLRTSKSGIGLHSIPEFPDPVWEPPGPARELPDPVQELPDTAWELPDQAQERSDPFQVAPDLVRQFLGWVLGSGARVSDARRVVVWARCVVWGRCGGVGCCLGSICCSDFVGVELS